MPSMSLFLSQLFNGLATGLLLALISTGLTIIYGTLGVVNFAHGALFVVGAYAGFATYGATDSFVIAIGVGALAALVVGLIMERGLVRLFYGRPPEDQILVTFGIGIVLVEIVRGIFGGVSLSVPTPPWGQGIVHIGSLIYPLYRLEALAISAGTLVVLYFVLYRTSLGLIVRAGIEDSLMVNILGINVKRIFLLVFGIGAMAAGYAGVIDAPIVTLAPDMGFRVLVDSFVVVVIGGVGSFPGAIIGGIIAGEILSLTSMFDPAYSDVMLFVAMALVLIFRPQGIMGQEGRE
ncbi:branched-chain amino acid ABC transporter permease [Paralcaligenes ureilyticus]|jgi:branched-chain amino acid transport system permease protein|uniref:Amino acid/amide ABC transporter membrane protein 1 (HAAT family) n=1 Tax=Paralcaligenes ureilyticus TaxID=627131 RepID=A0A4R3LQM8_9BURK|nr:branched-chain amino acid ABC transporter permease [Paralcaligenes ureilyticus]TCT02752.1 amino acid/amide ABC transporter membrane protein 1 (HAAT family) [Paralcaligenes ureilyticus]